MEPEREETGREEGVKKREREGKEKESRAGRSMVEDHGPRGVR